MGCGIDFLNRVGLDQAQQALFDSRVEITDRLAVTKHSVGRMRPAHEFLAIPGHARVGVDEPRRGGDIGCLPASGNFPRGSGVRRTGVEDLGHGATLEIENLVTAMNLHADFAEHGHLDDIVGLQPPELAPGDRLDGAACGGHGQPDRGEFVVLVTRPQAAKCVQQRLVDTHEELTHPEVSVRSHASRLWQDVERVDIDAAGPGSNFQRVRAVLETLERKQVLHRLRRVGQAGHGPGFNAVNEDVGVAAFRAGGSQPANSATNKTQRHGIARLRR